MRQEKQFLLDSITDAINNSKAFVITSYEKIDANATADFRSELVAAGGEFIAVKKRVFLKAVQKCGIEVETNNLDGHIALTVMGDNVVDATKKLYAFKKEKSELFKVLGGHFDGKVVTAEEVELISKLPTQDEMRAQLLSLFEAPMAETVSVMHALLTSVMHCLENKAQESAEIKV
ncbi:MAG: 50S ribosomal protein L10 [Rhabdochlamydiaceae bacterium]|nr:50S ribosomal protein L10 [Candidatus Amphrikana amoebophyrae]